MANRAACGQLQEYPDLAEKATAARGFLKAVYSRRKPGRMLDQNGECRMQNEE
jgi:hypothetical protein